MAEIVEAFPLAWPAGCERSKTKKDSAFTCTVTQARDGIMKQISLLKGTNVIISSNVPVKPNGEMYATQRSVDGDNGIAVYFTWKKDQYVLACDTYKTLWENLRAIEKSIEAIRGLERWGASDILSRAFTGFKALPEPQGEGWWLVLGVEKDADQGTIKSAYNLLAKKYHPDKPGGNHDMMVKVQAAYDKSKK